MVVSRPYIFCLSTRSCATLSRMAASSQSSGVVGEAEVLVSYSMAS